MQEGQNIFFMFSSSVFFPSAPPHLPHSLTATTSPGFRSVIFGLLNLESPMIFKRDYDSIMPSLYLSSKILFAHPLTQLKIQILNSHLFRFRFLFHSFFTTISSVSYHYRLVQARNGIFRGSRAQHNRLLLHNH